MQVRLIGVTKLANPEYVPMWTMDYSEQELLASICMAGCRTTELFDDMVDDTNPEQIKNRIAYAVREQHHTVLEFATFVFEIKEVSRVLTHELVRHRTASYLQQSQRAINQSEIGTKVPPSIQENEEALKIYFDAVAHTNQAYRQLLELKIPREDARYVCVNGKHTGIYMSIDGRNLMHLIKLRSDRRALWEIRELAERLYEIVLEVCPQMFSPELRHRWI